MNQLEYLKFIQANRQEIKEFGLDSWVFITRSDDPSRAMWNPETGLYAARIDSGGWRISLEKIDRCPHAETCLKLFSKVPYALLKERSIRDKAEEKWITKNCRKY
ncbi:hypothetical protein HN784_00610 [bacterium]|jgi:hypothetical protein|nr:hypothetical protein [bacterium]MBT4251579.1 hypothetical protein [bacterium]MBT4597628.1 hypothetical protein [bacterium]MBT6753642.1 hypothetical protein [bacterium]MBT7037779.1 hypothetical protein [bacterium]